LLGLHFAELLQDDISVAQHQECDTGDEGDEQSENHRKVEEERNLTVQNVLFVDEMIVTILQLYK
jgi:hypothetical protein